jgi:HTH-type transcriptional regulator/antitoxin HigA
MTISEILSIYDEFLKSFTSLLKVEDENSHKKALAAVDQLWKLTSDDESDPYDALLLLLADDIDKYESLDPGLNSFIEKSKVMPTGIAMLSILIDQRKLSDSDLPEIGDSSIVVQVLNGDSILSRSTIDGLALRFGISGGRFFD